MINVIICFFNCFIFVVEKNLRCLHMGGGTMSIHPLPCNMCKVAPFSKVKVFDANASIESMTKFLEDECNAEFERSFGPM
jgi:hypothetical protein